MKSADLGGDLFALVVLLYNTCCDPNSSSLVTLLGRKVMLRPSKCWSLRRKDWPWGSPFVWKPWFGTKKTSLYQSSGTWLIALYCAFTRSKTSYSSAIRRRGRYPQPDGLLQQGIREADLYNLPGPTASPCPSVKIFGLTVCKSSPCRSKREWRDTWSHLGKTNHQWKMKTSLKWQSRLFTISKEPGPLWPNTLRRGVSCRRKSTTWKSSHFFALGLPSGDWRGSKCLTSKEKVLSCQRLWLKYV